MKIAKILSGVLCVICATFGGIGFYYSKNPSEEEKFLVDYMYYIDNARVSAMPENIGSYDYYDYTCTNKVTGEWNESEWTFTPNLTDNTNCTLYFKTKTYEVNLAFNGAKNIDEKYTGVTTVKKGESIDFEVEYDEGYGFGSVECSNGEVGTFNEESNKVVIGPFIGNSSCEVTFKIKSYTVKLETKNGTPGSQTVNVEHGKKATLDVEPTENYTFDNVTCTNDQEATFKEKNNTLNIAKVTSNTSCSLKFKLKSFKITVKVDNGTVDTESKKVAYGKSETFSITANDGYTLDEATVECKGVEAELNNAKLQVSSVTKDTTCTVKLKEKPEEEIPQETTE